MANKRGDCFITPEGDILKLAPGGHIETVIAEPETFGLNKEMVSSTYEKHGESYWQDGEARTEILVHLFEEGWFRVNYDEKGDRFLINTGEINDQAKKALKAFAERVAQGYFGIRLGYSAVFVHLVKNGSIVMSSVDLLIAGNDAFEVIRNSESSSQGKIWFK